MTDKKKAGSGQDIHGEGNYTATRNFDRAQENFVKSHKDEIAKKGEEAKQAVEGKEGADLRKAEEQAKSRSKSPGDER